jgi:hypothetical protein
VSARGWTIAGVCALVAVSLLLHHDALGGWWLTDDPQVLLHAALEGPLAVLFSPSAYRYLSSSSFTPLVTISFDLDLALAGLRPSFFYGHQIGALTVAAVLLFLLLARVDASGGDRRLSLPPAWLAAAAFAAAPASVHIARGLMTRHYVEGLCFALGALLVWDTKWRWRSIVAAALYLLAMLAKEVYAPLPLLMLWQARARGGTWRSIVREFIPLSAAASVYIVWRVLMLGSFGGYGGGTAGGFARTISSVAGAMLGPMPWWAYALAGVCAGLLIARGATASMRKGIGFIAAAGIFTLLPLAGAGGESELRYGFVLTVVLLAGASLAASTSRFSAIPLGILSLLAVVGGWRYEQKLDGQTRSIVTEGKYVFSQPAGAPALFGSAPPWYFTGLSELRRLRIGDAGPRFILSHDGFILGGVDTADSVRVTWGTDALRPLTADEIAEIESERMRFDGGLPLSVGVAMRNHEMSWTVGPVPGDFALVTIPHYARFPMPSTGRRRLPESREQQMFRIRRALPDGRWTASPELPLPQGTGTVNWKR